MQFPELDRMLEKFHNRYLMAVVISERARQIKAQTKDIPGFAGPHPVTEAMQELLDKDVKVDLTKVVHPPKPVAFEAIKDEAAEAARQLLPIIEAQTGEPSEPSDEEEAPSDEQSDKDTPDISEDSDAEKGAPVVAIPVEESEAKTPVESSEERELSPTGESVAPGVD